MMLLSSVIQNKVDTLVGTGDQSGCNFTVTFAEDNITITDKL